MNCEWQMIHKTVLHNTLKNEVTGSRTNHHHRCQITSYARKLSLTVHIIASDTICVCKNCCMFVYAFVTTI